MLNRLRRQGFDRIEPMLYTEFEAYQRVTGNLFTFFEAQLLFELFNVFDHQWDLDHPKIDGPT